MTPAAQPTARWHGLPIGHWLIEWDVPELLVFDSVPSTNYIARVRAEAGAPAGLIVLADHQSAGRGRLGRTWH
ncbi:MAG: bifunctional biotin--[acetyl-CoA-carboxylase] synthetase/biotin operon repressor, partial [Gemmatimonadota bacterium]